MWYSNGGANAFPSPKSSAIEGVPMPTNVARNPHVSRGNLVEFWTVAYRNLTDGQLEQGEAHVAVHVADGHVECVLRHLISRECRRNVTGLKFRHIAVSIAFAYVSKTT